MIKRHGFSLLPFVRDIRGSNGKLQAIYLRITVDGQRKEISTKCLTDPSKWNSVKGRAINNGETAGNQTILAMVFSTLRRFWRGF